MLVYVININNEPLMPCSPVIARLLLKGKKAKVIRNCPFTIKLLYKSTNYIEELTHGMDTGSSTIGSAVVNKKNEVLYMSEIVIRNDISKKMDRRRMYRKNRRNKNTRYRKTRFLNRVNSIKKDRFSPTMISKINSHLKEISFVKSILPISKLILEIGKFDPFVLNNPEVQNKKWLYQKGINYGFANRKAYILDRDKYNCQYCHGKSKDKKLHVHHIIFKCNGGSDDENNLVTLCKTCHDSLHRGEITLKRIGKIKHMLKHATQMNSIRIQLLKVLNCEETFGYITSENRNIYGLIKKHYMDAIVIASTDIPKFKTNIILYKRCVSDGDYRMARGNRSEMKLPMGKILGFRRFDKVKYMGKKYFIKARESCGYAILMEINGTRIDLKHLQKFSKMTRISARKTWIMTTNNI